MLVAFSICGVVFLASLLMNLFLINFLRKKEVLDQPNQRSNHEYAIPRGGGLGVLFAIFVGYLLSSYANIPMPSSFLIFASMFLGLIFFIDDLKNINILIRLGAQFACCYTTLHVLFIDTLFFNGLFSPLLDKLLITIIWVGFINAFNFMDGINGISFIETATITVGILIISVHLNNYSMYLELSAIIFFSTLGFVIWNLKNKIFLGDIGSITLGFLLGFLLLHLWKCESYVYAFILPFYYLADTSLTIIKRLLKGEKIWHAHSQHFYQKAYRKCRSTKNVLSIIMSGNIILISVCLLENRNIMLAAAFASVMMQMFFLTHLKPMKNENISNR